MKLHQRPCGFRSGRQWVGHLRLAVKRDLDKCKLLVLHLHNQRTVPYLFVEMQEVGEQLANFIFQCAHVEFGFTRFRFGHTAWRVEFRRWGGLLV